MNNTKTSSVPLLDLQRQYSTLDQDISNAIRRVVDAQTFILGEDVANLEKEVADLHGVQHGIGVASGTDALLLPLKALDLEPDQEVITTPFTFFATAGAIHNAGGRPRFVDIDPETFNIDPALVDDAVGPNTRAMVPVHLFGQMADMVPLRETADRNGLFVLEDAAQAIGARQKVEGEWKMPGEVGDCAAFSFFPSKNLGGFGDGGMIVADDDELATRLRRLRVHGGMKMYHHDEVGTNSRLDALQAAILLEKLPHLASWSQGRRRNAQWYNGRFEQLESAGYVKRPVVTDSNESIYNQYTLRVTDRDALRQHLSDNNIGCAVYYPLPLHLQPCFSYLGHTKGDFPESERAAEEVISIPVFPELTEDELEAVASTIEEFYA